jgi:hypothetical protein
VADQAKALKEAEAKTKKTKADRPPSIIDKTKTKIINGAYNLTDIITLLVKENPKMEGSAARKPVRTLQVGDDCRKRTRRGALGRGHTARQQEGAHQADGQVSRTAAEVERPPVMGRPFDGGAVFFHSRAEQNHGQCRSW